ncbi:alanine racemase [Roseisolibacter agri]|uniref:Alanine racemase n=1 Tax=Roseisolibacter agri TaxID=2014610 RepID=A0AA37V7E0_9BACT|nr:alanine racemase [Roseisolibacter agri]GLC26501.1 alanine racemase [Roseisolibacter agri]
MPAESNPAVLAPTGVVRPDAGADADLCADRQRAWVDVDLAALVRNARRVQAHARVPLLPMVKADAYGLGAIPVARALRALSPWAFGVAAVHEGEALRDAGITDRIVVFTPLLASELPRAHAAGLTPSLHRGDDVRAWAAIGGDAWHLSIDTGMSRAGVRWDAVDALHDAIRAHPPEGAYTHFHSADTDDASRAEQEARFDAAVRALPARPQVVHAENSPGAERAQGGSRWDVVRPGVFLYGVSAGAVLEAEPVAHLRARVVDVRDLRDGETVSYGATWTARGPARIATVAAGYADGYRRALSNRGVALLHGREVPVAGRVTMDMTMLDVTGVPCAVGDVATLIGRDGDALLTVSDVADRAEMSPYELLTGLRQRVPHLHHDA